MINASVGGTPIEAWISEDGYKSFPKFLEVIERNKDTSYVNSLSGKHNHTNNSSLPKDKGLTGKSPWYSLDFEPKNWRRINIPGYWEDQGRRSPRPATREHTACHKRRTRDRTRARCPLRRVT